MVLQGLGREVRWTRQRVRVSSAAMLQALQESRSPRATTTILTWTQCGWLFLHTRDRARS